MRNLSLRTAVWWSCWHMQWTQFLPDISRRLSTRTLLRALSARNRGALTAGSQAQLTYAFEPWL